MLMMLMCGIAIALGGWGLSNQHNLQVQNCEQIENLKAVVRRTIERSAEMLGHHGTAGYAYYHTHPAELAAARAAARAELSNFGPKPCP